MKRFGFPNTLRLRSQAEFKPVFSQPMRSSSLNFTVLARPNGKELPRLGLVIAKRYMKRAVDRNWVKRRIRESFRLNQSRLLGLDVVVLLKGKLSKSQERETLYPVLFKHWQDIITLWKNGSFS